MIKKIFIVLTWILVAVAGLVISSGWFIGRDLEPLIEKKLTELFGMSVTIENLYAHPVTGKVKADRVTFHNQARFDPRPHFDIQGMEFNVDVPSLLRRKILIRNMILTKPFYFIEKKDAEYEGGPGTNVTTWYRHMKSLRKEKDPQEEKKQSWELLIENIVLKEGAFLYIDSREESPTKWYFHNYDGYLRGLRWPTEDPTVLDQEVMLEGLFGEISPTPFKITGFASFATSQVSFDLVGRIEEGDVSEHTSLWRGLPIQVNGGLFEFDIHAVCYKRDFNADNILTLKSLEVESGPKRGEAILGVPYKAWLAFVQQEEILRLEIPVRGKISDPDFKFQEAFNRAFVESLKFKTQTGILKLKQFAKGAQRLPGKVVDGLERITSRDKSEEESLAASENTQ